MKTKLALFDLDGTLFDTGEVNFMAYKTALEECGFSLDHDYYVDKCNGMQYKVFLPGIVGHNVEIMERVHIRKKALYESFLNRAKINKHLFSIARALKEDYYIAIVTTASKKNTMEILNYFHKTDLFDLILTQEDIQQPKPDPEGFLKAMEYFKINGENTVIFEDSQVGIMAAKECNATVMVVNQFK